MGRKKLGYGIQGAMHDPAACAKQAYAELDALVAREGRAPYGWGEERREELRLLQERAVKALVQRWMDAQPGGRPAAWDIVTQQLQPAVRTFFATVRCDDADALFDGLSVDWLDDDHKGVTWDARTRVSAASTATFLGTGVGVEPGKPHHRFEVRRSRTR